MNRTVYIKDGKRINIHAPYLDTVKLRNADLTDPVEREAYGVTSLEVTYGNDETQYTQEIDEAPYVIITDKPQEMVDAAWNSKINAQIAALEASELLPRIVRDLTFKSLAEDAAAAGTTLDALYAMASLPDAPGAAKAYKKFKDFDDSIIALKHQLR